MFKANGKEWSNYYKSERTPQYLQSLKRSTRFPADPVTMITDGPNEPRDTYIQPRLSIDLARWVNAPFAMYMDGWFLDEVDSQTTTPVSSQTPSSGTYILNLLAHTTDPTLEACTSLTFTTNHLITSIKQCVPCMPPHHYSSCIMVYRV